MKKFSFLAKKYINILSCFDATQAKIAKSLNYDAILVGDSLSIFSLGHQNINKIDVNDIIYHLQSIREATNLPVIADLPKSSMANNKLAISHAKKLIKAGASMIKIEGHSKIKTLISSLVKLKIPVCSHIGLTPQNDIKITDREIFESALLHEKIGCSLIVLSKINDGLCKKITSAINIPSIGYINYKNCDGQVEIFYKMLGLVKGEELKIEINPKIKSFKK